MVLLIIALAAVALLPMISNNVEQTRIQQERSELQQYKQILLGYVSANGRFPCPATHPSLGGGATDSLGLGNPSPPGITNCAVQLGFLPARSLNLTTTNPAPQGLLPTPFGAGASDPRFMYRYALTNLAAPGAIEGGGAPPAGLIHAFANVNGSFPMNGLGAGQIRLALNADLLNGRGLSVCATRTNITASSCGDISNVVLTDLVAVIFSSGANVINNSLDEAENIEQARQRIYILPPALRRESGSPEGIFDDQFIGISFPEYLAALSAGGWTIRQ
ncbi:hypothetical protein DU000_11390 [Parvibium lacunae]|uniref:Type II secretion system protein n=2 Tax=Parvibium lacunae TaxID=1888893 RepID=A0A368KZI1_9BURK|nr:hypothetical protein DU000_11390 [Parvibium lacunae]